MLEPKDNEILSDDMIRGVDKDVTVADITAFSRAPNPYGLQFELTNAKMHWVREPVRPYVTIFGPEYGQRVQVLNNTGIALVALDRYEEALEASLGATAFAPRCADAYNTLGVTLSRLQKHRDSISAYRTAIKINPHFFTAYCNLGTAFLHLGRTDEAILAYRKALTINPRYPLAYNGLGETLRVLGRNEEALEAYNQALMINPRDPLPHFNAGRTLRELGRYKEAAESYRSFLNAPDNKSPHLVAQAEQALAELARTPNA